MAGATWNLVVNPQTDQDLREFLAREGEQQDLSSFVEDAVKDKLFRLTVQEAKQCMAHLSPQEIEDLVDEAIEWARATK